MRLASLLDVIPGADVVAAGGDPAAEITGFAIDHRKVAPGTIFGAFRGSRLNGEDFIAEAIASGAIAVVARRQARVEGAVHVVADEPRRCLADLAARFFAPYPQVMVAVTGTNGKTSTVEMTRQLWRMAGLRSASVGTLGVTTADDQVKTGLTTPDIVTFLSNMSGLRKMGIDHVAYEASSHGLDQYRSEGLPVAAAAFTNFSRDHLDYHGTMEAYFEAKMRLFDEVVDEGGTAVVWTGDAKSDEVCARARRRGLPLLTVGPGGETIDLKLQSPSPLGQTLLLGAGGKDWTLKLPLIGAYQAANVLVAAGLVLATGGNWEQTFAGLGRLSPVRGRLERAVITATGAPVYVDYAHTPDALEAAIAALRPHVAKDKGGRLITLIGAGGDRDQGKRPEMGRVTAEASDLVIVTDDNPRSEDPAAIRRAILDGAPGAMEVGGRREAILAALRGAREGDIVLLAGKGHETVQVIGDTSYPFDDAAVARECAA